MTGSGQLIGITGATGAIGGRIATRLAAAGAAQRLIVRDTARAPALDRAEVRAAPGGYADTDGLREALDGVHTLLLVSAMESATRVDEHLSAVEAAVTAGVQHLVYVSFLGAAPDATFTFARDHAATEAAIRERGVPFTFLRDSLYADFLPGLVGADGVVRGPAGTGRVAPVARDDVADAAAAVLLAPEGHAGMTYDLTGPEALTLGEATAILAEISGLPLHYHAEELQEAFEARMDPDVPDFMIDGWVTSYLAIREGELDVVSPAVRELTGHDPLGLREVVARLPGCLDHVTAR